MARQGCGLMQESKDIQRESKYFHKEECCGLMQESKDIQQLCKLLRKITGCGLMQESKDIQQPDAKPCWVCVVV